MPVTPKKKKKARAATKHKYSPDKHLWLVKAVASECGLYTIPVRFTSQINAFSVLGIGNGDAERQNALAQVWDCTKGCKREF